MSTETEILAALQHEARKPSRNAATLTHNIRATFPFLETQWDDKARQIIGALVAVNASRMHSTIWAALFQQLREASGASIKVYIFKQFANVCWTVPRTQGANAFRAFALEIRPLLSDIQIVTNTAFQKHFSSIVCYLTHFADEGLSLELYNTLYANLVEWKRVDALRAASNVIVELVLRVPHCPTVETLLARAKEDMDLFLYTILLDTVVAADTSEDHSQSRERISFFCQEVARVMSCVLESAESNAKSIPPLVSTYRRVKSFCKSWEPADAAAFVASIFKALNSDNVSKLLICPYLQFLQTSSCEWPASSDVVWKYTESTDPFVRADAFLALSTKALALDVSEKRLAIAELLDKLHIFLAENCSYTIVAVLKYLRVLLLSSDIPLPTQQLYLTRLLHVCSRYGKDLQGDAGAQLELLSLFAAASTLPEAAQKYIVRIFLVSSDRAVAAKAFEALLHISATCKLDDETRAFHGSNTAHNNFDSFICTDHADNSVESPSLLFSSQRGDILTALICERLSQWRFSEVNESVNRIIACDAVRRLCDCVTDENLSVTDSLHATLTLFSQLLVSQEEMSSEVSISLVRASAACVKLRDLSTASDLPLLSRLVQQTWSVLADCAALLHPDFIPSAEATTLRFFRTDATPFHMHDLIVKCRDIALSNEVAFHSSVFYEIVECNALLLTECVAALADSPLFLCEATSNIEAVFKCCDAFFPCSPKQTLRFLTVLLDALVSFETASSETNPEIKRFALSFSKCCSSLVNHAITLNFQSYCPQLCSFLLLCLQKGSLLSVGVFSELIANNWTFVADLASFCKSECICYGNSDEGSSVLSMLRLLRCLCWSSYRDEIVNAIPCSAIDNIAAASHKWRWFAEREECRHLILDLQRIYTQQTHNTENNLPSIINEQTPPSFFFERLEHVIDLWNVSDAPAQNTIREQLLHENTGCSLTILAAVDNVYIPTAVAFVLSHQEEEFVLELLLLVIRESTLEDLPPLEFYVHSSVLGAADHLVKDVIQSYKWGWVAGPNTEQFLCNPTVKNSHTVLRHFVNHVGRSLVKSIVTDGSDKFSSAKMVSESLLLPHQLLSSAPYTRNTKYSLENFAFYSSAEEILLFNSDTALRLLNQAFAKQDNFADLSDPHVIFLFAKHISTVSASGFFLWDLSEWIALLRSWVSVALTTQPESEQWAWLLLSCWTLFYRVFEHLFSVAKHGHPSYPKENGTVFFEEMRRIYIQLSNSFLCCDAKSVDEVAFFVVRYALKNDVFFEIGGIFEEIFWCVARTCVDAAWLVVKGERCASLLDPEVVKFMCRMQGKLGLPLHMQRSAHTLFAVHLRKYGCSNSDLEVDAQRHVLWLSGSFGTRLYSLSAAKGGGRGGGQLAVAEHSAELNDHAVFRSAVLTDIFKVIHESLGGLAQASPSAVFDSLNALRGVLHWTAISSTSSQAHGGTVDVEQAFEITRGFISSCSPLSRAAPSQPATHCLRSLLNEFPLPRRVSAFTDEYALSVTTTILSTALASWLRRVSVLSAPPAYVPCTLAVYLPYLLRLDLPLYLTALGCVESLVAFTASAEVDAVYRVVLPRLTEDLVDVHWSAQVTSGWTQALIAVLGSIHGSGCGGTEQLARRVWEGVWRGASSPDVCHSQAARENVQAALKQLIGGLVPKSAQWELSRLVVLSASAQRPEPTAVAATPPDVRGWDVQLPLRIVAALELSHWRTLLAETQTHFALHAARGLDADSSRSLLFEFEKAVESLLECVGGAITFTGEDQQCCLLRERVTMTLLSPTDAVLAALNHFEYSDWDRRRSVVLQLRAMAVSAAQVHPEPTTTSSPWTDVYFDVLFERATCIDEGLWASCAVAAVEASGGHLEWAIPALQSLVAASSTRRKRGFLRRVAEAAKLRDTQARVRAFFAGASDRLAASTTPVAVWKSELLVEVTFCFSASS